MRQRLTESEIDHRFTYHPPTGASQTSSYIVLRASGKNLAKDILAYCPESREQSLALTHVEEAVMWANAAIARRS